MVAYQLLLLLMPFQWNTMKHQLSCFFGHIAQDVHLIGNGLRSLIWKTIAMEHSIKTMGQKTRDIEIGWAEQSAFDKMGWTNSRIIIFAISKSRFHILFSSTPIPTQEHHNILQVDLQAAKPQGVWTCIPIKPWSPDPLCNQYAVFDLASNQWSFHNHRGL